MKNRKKKVFHLHYAIMGFQISYCTKVITINFSLKRTQPTRFSPLKRLGCTEDKTRLLVSGWRGNNNIKKDSSPPPFFLNALGEDSDTVLLLLVPEG